MSFTRDWSEITPIDHTLNSSWPDYDRRAKVDVADRLADIISGFNSGETVLGALKLPFIAVSSPSTVTAQVQLFGKADSGKTRLKMIDEDGNETFVMPCRAGDVLLSSSSTTPPGFTDVSATYANKMIRISSTALSTGGSDTISGATDSHVLDITEIPAHTHSYSTPPSPGAGNSGSSYSGTPTTQTTGSTGGGLGHTHTLTSISCVNAYVTLKAYQKS